MARWENCQEVIEKGKWGACNELIFRCPNDNGGYGLIRKMVDELTLTDSEYQALYGYKRE